MLAFAWSSPLALPSHPAALSNNQAAGLLDRENLSIRSNSCSSLIEGGLACIAWMTSPTETVSPELSPRAFSPGGLTRATTISTPSGRSIQTSPCPDRSR
ncbi:hypothetical protein BC834DRAFT_56786 [Gloeopeniophorella convolvens]|nr:hypothetical protein BC834DRAFT_56786 [Gloeopeniophorella convolvens]